MSDYTERTIIVCLGILVLGFIVVIALSEEYKQQRCIEAIKTQNQESQRQGQGGNQCQQTLTRWSGWGSTAAPSPTTEPPSAVRSARPSSSAASRATCTGAPTATTRAASAELSGSSAAARCASPAPTSNE